MSIERDHFERLRAGLANVYELSTLDRWIETKTYLDGKKFSFFGHEFQRTVLQDPAKTSIVVKCAQVGLSEILARWTLAACTTQENFTIIYTFPNTSDAEKFNKTRVDPCIRASPELRLAVSKNLDNSEIKQFGANSFLYFRGTRSETAALSVPADAIVHDEVDKCDLDNMSVYVSRLQHKPTKIRKLFSTPTVKGYGISKEAETARRHRQFLKCSHCNHYFMPDYFDHVHIPGWDRDKREITKSNLKDVNWQQAVLLCPKCGKAPDQGIEYRSWECENKDENYPANAWFVSPFCAPTVVTPALLVKGSTEYRKFSEFTNQALGLPDEDASDAITQHDVERMRQRAELSDSGTHILGADMGLLCRILVGRVAPSGELLIVHMERVPYHQFEQRRTELCRQYRITISVHDVQPYVDMITRITEYDPNAYGAVFSSGSTAPMFAVREQDPDAAEGKMNMRRVMLNRTEAFDTLLQEIKEGRVLYQDNPLADDYDRELQSLKKVQKFDRTQELFYAWDKTDGEDHFHFATMYLMIAAKLRGTVNGFSTAGRVSLVSTFKLRGEAGRLSMRSPVPIRR